jgi:triacylglycerol esterase/lipase EstA (alpha/beta hydrolase family)
MAHKYTPRQVKELQRSATAVGDAVTAASAAAKQAGLDALMCGRYLLGTPVDLAAVATMAVVTLPFLLCCDGSHSHRPQAAAPLVVLVHGSNVSPAEFILACMYLRRAGIPYYCAAYNSRQPVNESVEEVRVHVRTELRRRRQPGVVFVGHSQGGLIARLVARYFDQRHQQSEGHGKAVPSVRLVILLNAPQKGARLAYARGWITRAAGFAVSGAYRDMTPGSAFLKGYAAPTAYVEQFPLLEVSGCMDHINSEESRSPSTIRSKWRPRHYTSWFGHNFSAVNPVLWRRLIVTIMDCTVGNPVLHFTLNDAWTSRVLVTAANRHKTEAEAEDSDDSIGSDDAYKAGDEQIRVASKL